MRITTVGLDADDTLWHNETIFRLTQDRLRDLMAEYAPPDLLESKLAEVEARNLRLYGYGVKGFTLSVIETVMELTQNQAPGRLIADILAAGREMLSEPVEPLPGVDQALAELSEDYRLVLITKGDLARFSDAQVAEVLDGLPLGRTDEQLAAEWAGQARALGTGIAAAGPMKRTAMPG